MKIIFRLKIPILPILVFVLAGTIFNSCKDDYFYNDREPDFLGSSIYDFMEQDGHFTYYLRLVNDLNYKDVLSYTGSKTLLPARDDAFERFFQNNEYGVTSYEGLSTAQKRSIMNVSMINMAYLSKMLANTPTSQAASDEGLALRRNTTLTFLDSISYLRDETLFSNPFWNRFSTKGLYLIDNEKPAPIVHFTSINMLKQGITDQDFSKLNNGLTFDNSTFYVNGVKVLKKDIICKNGYVHVMDDLILPSKNMAQIIRDNGETNLFNKLLNKFCMPYFVETVSKTTHDYYDGSTPDRPLIAISDSIFVKRYFTTTFNLDANGKTLTNYGLLYYDPSDNAYTPSALQQDMGAMFVPTDDAMSNYINGDKGRYLKDAYGSWENIPTPLLALFVRNHQKKSFLNSLPHSWPTLTDESSAFMNVKADNISKSYIGNNGAVYISSVVYPPIDYQCVYASVLTSNDTKIMNWGIQDATMKFYLYLRSMENMYNLIVPVDAAFDNYRDPIAWAKGISSREIWSFKYVADKNMVYADVYNVTTAGQKGTKTRSLTNSTADQAIIRNRLNDIIDMHIVVGQKVGENMSGYIDDGTATFAQTKSGTMLKISGSGENTQVIGGGDLEQNVSPAHIVTNPNSGLKSLYNSDNGKTYFIDQILQDPTKSVYTLLGEHPEYKAFFDLLKGDDRVFTFFQLDKDVVPVFSLKKMSSSSGLGYVVNSFNNFRYTIFVPTEQALNQAFASDAKLFTWDEIANETDYNLKKEKTLYLLKFLKYHFMDNSTYINGKPVTNLKFETAARDDSGKFFKLEINGNGSDLHVKCTNPSNVANVIKTDGLYNQMARDYIVNNGDYMRATQIISSSRAVIHLIDKALKF
ncbi:MAG TPA: fasciclin domain-containing protein [Bacteroidales bacterium]|nr:fasciclin domain-containing protein [Bacteroidales bacterium]